MRQLPILFSTPMVQAIQENRKVMTRRTAGLEKVNKNPDDFKIMNLFYMPDGTTGMVQFDHKGLGFVYGKPRYNVGDQLWIKETWNKVKLENDTEITMYKEDTAYPENYKWKSSLFMPKAAARIWLEVTEVRCERLHDISEADAIAEGVLQICDYGTTGYIDYTRPDEAFSDIDAKWSFQSLWQSINGLDSLNANPWVFVYTFKRIPKP